VERLPHLLAVLVIAPAEAAPTEWLEETVLADCQYCRTEAFREERKRLANQIPATPHASFGMGYVVTIDDGGRFVWGRAALVGTGNLIRTDAHVLFADTGQWKHAGRAVYFEPMHYGWPSDLIEIDPSSGQRGGTVGPLEADVKNDWAIARLQEDAIAKFNGDRVIAFLWDARVTHDDIVERELTRAAALVTSHEHTFALHASCEAVTDDHPSHYAFGVDEVFFTRCPSEYLQTGSSGSALAILSPDAVWSLGGQIVAGGATPRVRAGAGAAALGRPLEQQLFLGNVPSFRQALAIAYLQELIRRGMDPRQR
jgi:hypothetical protein